MIDAAKVLAVAGGDFTRVRRFLKTGAGAEDLRAVPIIAVPTTAGTGSEAICWAAVGVDADSDAALQTIFGPDLEAGAERLAEFLAGLGVSVDPAGHGVADQEWREIVERAFAGARGKNYVGTLEGIEAAVADTAAAR